jgi:hypothetical protein
LYPHALSVIRVRARSLYSIAVGHITLSYNGISL